MVSNAPSKFSLPLSSVAASQRTATCMFIVVAPEHEFTNLHPHSYYQTSCGANRFTSRAIRMPLVFVADVLHFSNMSRKWFTLTSLFLTIFGTRTTAADSPASRPNVIIILADDLGYGDLACYGHPTFKTPNLDRMAAEGARLTHFNTPAPFCAPTRASLMTGRYPFRCGMTANPSPDLGGQNNHLDLPVSEITIADLFHRAGYATGMVGKWHLGHSKPEFFPTHRGFDEYFGILYSNDMRPVQILDGDKVVEYPVVQATLTSRYTEHALDFIERNKAKPFFFYFAHAMPHKPLAASEKYYKTSGAGLYGDVISELDASVGAVLAKVKELGLNDR